MKESWHTYYKVMSHTCISHGTYRNNYGWSGKGLQYLLGATKRVFPSFIYSETQIIARDSHTNRLKSEDTESTDSVY